MKTISAADERPVPTGSASGRLAALGLPMLLSSIGTSIANVGLPTLALAFGATFQQIQWVVLAYLLAVTTTIVSVGRLGDLVGRRRLLLAGILLFTAAATLCGLSPTLWLLVVGRALQGVGAAVMMGHSLAMVGEAAPAHKTGAAMGLMAAMSAVGTALGPAVGGLLIEWAGWPSIFFIAVPLGLLAFGLVISQLPQSPAAEEKAWASFDVTGSLLLAGTLGSYALATTVGRGSFGLLNVGLLAASVTGLILFLIWQARVATPLMQLAIFREASVRAGLLMSVLVSTVLMATLVVGPFYLSRGLRLDAAAVGIVMSIGPIVVALMGVPAGRAVDRFGSQRTTVAGVSGIGLGCLLLSLVPTSSGIFGYILATVVLTAGYAVFQTANNSAVMTNADPGKRGLISGMLNLSRNLGLITGASVMAGLFAAAAGTADLATAPSETIAAAMRFTFGIAALLMMLALAAAAGGKWPGLAARVGSVRTGAG